MNKLTSLPLAAVGVTAQAVRTAGDRLDTARKNATTKADAFLADSITEGRAVVSRIPGAASLLGATNSADQPVTDVVGVDARAGAKLRRAGITTVSDLWTHAGDRTGRSDISGTTGISADRLEEWAKRADLMRVKAIGPAYANLLEAAGVTSLKQLRRRSAASLHESLVEINAKSKIVDTVPGLDEIKVWIERADLIAS